MLLDDTQISFTGRWQFHINPIIPNQFHSFHATNHTGDLVSLNFTGTSIELYGLIGPTNGNFSVQLDDNVSNYTGLSTTTQQALLFSQRDLDASKEHQLTVTNLLEGHLLTIDILNITQSSPSPPVSSSHKYSHISRGSIIAIALIGAFCFLILLGSFGYLVRRRRAKRAKQRRARSTESIAPRQRMRSIQLPSDQGREVLEERFPWMRDIENPPRHDPLDQNTPTPFDPYAPRTYALAKLQRLPPSEESVIDITPRTRHTPGGLRLGVDEGTHLTAGMAPPPSPGNVSER